MKVICPECYFRYEFCDQALLRLDGLNYIWCYRCDHLMSVVNNVEIRVFGDGKEVKKWFPKDDKIKYGYKTANDIAIKDTDYEQ